MPRSTSARFTAKVWIVAPTAIAIEPTRRAPASSSRLAAGGPRLSRGSSLATAIRSLGSMSDDEKNRLREGDHDIGSPRPGSGLSEAHAVRKDMTYSPASETETQAKQADPLPDTI